MHLFYIQRHKFNIFWFLLHMYVYDKAIQIYVKKKRKKQVLDNKQKVIFDPKKGSRQIREKNSERNEKLVELLSSDTARQDFSIVFFKHLQHLCYYSRL